LLRRAGFGSAAAAKSELARREPGTESRGRVSRFVVPGLPRASAFRVGTSSDGDDSIWFTDGRFLYFVGMGWGNGARPARAALIVAAESLYERVHSHATTQPKSPLC
jgi:hypothetical protein